MALEHLLCEEGNLFPAFAQGRDHDGEGADAVVEIFAEGVPGDRLLDIDVGRGDDADVDSGDLAGAEAGEATILENM